jgi:two-component system response regulator PilR (NtrC family)
MRALVIDDDETFCRLLVELLEQKGIQAESTTDGFAAYALLDRERFDLCIIDVRMPLVLGTELAEAIQQDRPQSKIILISAFADEALRNFAVRHGIVLLSKPFTATQLFDAVRHVSGRFNGFK